jgi:hypothetical protein
MPYRGPIQGAAFACHTYAAQPAAANRITFVSEW